MKTFVMAAAAAVVGGSVGATTISIDDFTTTQGVVSAPPTASDTQTAPAGAIGDRTITAESTVQGFTTGRINFFDTELFQVSNDDGAQGVVTVSYDLGGLDLTVGGLDTIVVGVESIDLTGLFTVDVDGTTAGSTVSTTGDLNFAFDDFTGADFTSVDTLSFSVGSNGTDSLDSSFTFIGVQDLQANVVPLPAGGALLLTGFAGLVALRRRKG